MGLFTFSLWLLLQGFSSSWAHAATRDVKAGPLLAIDYAELVDKQVLTHSGATVGELLQRLQRASPEVRTQSQRRALAELEKQRRLGRINAREFQELKEFVAGLDKLTRIDTEERQALVAQLEPVLEPFAFLLQDAMDTRKPSPTALADLGYLFPEGVPQPAWAALVRSRRYFVLSDGLGYVRLYVPGKNAEQSYAEHWQVIRHVLAFILRSSPQASALEVDIHAYANDFEHQRLTLNMTPKHMRLQAADLSRTRFDGLKLGTLENFLAQRVQLEGLSLEEPGQLALFGRKTAMAPTLEGQPISLADLAVAYRAVFHSGHDRAYISLDPSNQPGRVAVNFGGRLQDTALGWVVLRSDLRFKTLVTGMDPVMGTDIHALLQQRVPGFLTQIERMVRSPEGTGVSMEETRFWFYPDGISVKVADNGRTAQIGSPRFTADAERQNAVGSDDNDRPTSKQTPPWTKELISHFNGNYDVYADSFPEIRELDQVGRLLALFTWLKQRKDAGALKVDLDELLDVELPACSTPRHLPQGIFIQLLPKSGPGDVLSYDISTAIESHLRHQDSSEGYESKLASVRSKLRDRLLKAAEEDKAQLPRVERALARLDASLARLAQRLAQEDIEASALALALPQITKDPRSSVSGMTEVTEKFEPAVVINGGLDLDLSKALRSSALDAQGRAIQATVLSRLDGSGVVIGEEVWQRSSTSNAAPVLALSGRPHALEQQSSLGTVGFGIRGSLVYANARTPTGMPAWSRTAVNDATRPMSRTVYSSAHSTATYFVRNEQDYLYKYGLQPGREAMKVVRADSRYRPIEADLQLLLQQRQAGLPDWHWRYLPEDTRVLAVDTLEDGRLAVLYKIDGGQESLVYWDGESRPEIIPAPLARKAFEDIGRRRVAAASTEQLHFLHAALDGDFVVLQRGTEQRRIPREQMRKLMAEPKSPEKSDVDDMLGRSGELVVYRDGIERRPRRYGASLRDGSEADPVLIAGLINERYVDTRALLDDEVALAKANRAAIVPVRSRADLVALVPDKDVGVDQRGNANILKMSLLKQGIQVAPAPEALGKVPNVLLVSGHNNPGLYAYLENMGNQGHLKDRVLLLMTCGAVENPERFHELIVKYGARAVLLHPEAIRPVALKMVIEKLGPLLDEAQATGKSLDPIDLMKRAALKSLNEDDLSEALRYEITRLVRSTLQISQDDSGRPEQDKESQNG